MPVFGIMATVERFCVARRDRAVPSPYDSHVRCTTPSCTGHNAGNNSPRLLSLELFPNILHCRVCRHWCCVALMYRKSTVIDIPSGDGLSYGGSRPGGKSSG